MSTQQGVSALWFAIGMAACALLGALPVTGSSRVSRWMRGVRAAGPSMLALAAVGVLMSFGAFGAALIRHDFTLRYVAEWTSVLLSARLTLAALAASDVGVRFAWSAAIAAVALLVAVRLLISGQARRNDTATFVGLVAAVLMAAVVSLVVGLSPFGQLANAPLDGRGLPPLLRSAIAIAQPALQLLGLACALLPLAHVAAAVIDGRSMARWRGAATRALVLAWCLQTLALVAGLWWAQQQTGWFGWWLVWTPWSSAPLLPWFATTIALGATAWSSEGSSREVFAAGSIAFASCLAGFAAWQLRVGTALSIVPIPADATLPARTRLIAVGVGALGMLVLLGIVWRRVRDVPASARLRSGAIATTLGALCVAVGFAASLWRSSTVVPLEMGTPHTLRDPFGGTWTITSQGMSSYREPTHAILAAAVALNSGGKRVGLLTSEQRQYLSIDGEPAFDPVTSVGTRSTLRTTVTTIFDRPMSRDVAAVRVGFVPLAWMPFAGALLMLLAVPVVAWPSRTDTSDSTSHAMTDHTNDAAEAAIARARARQRSCPVHGPRAEPDARFCSECGSALEGVCATCGTPAADPNARYCAECGAAFAR